jgi:transketolase
MIATRDAYGKKLAEMGEKYSDIVVLDADLTKSTKTEEFAKKFPDRFFNMGVAEANMVNTAAGMAASGKVPFASSFAIFATGRTWEQIRNTICYSRLNVKIVGTHGGISVGEDGASHQAVEDIALMRAISELTVIVPADGPETANAIKAVYDHQGPVYVRLGRAKVETVTNEDDEFVIGKGRIMREGADATIISCGLMTPEALKAARQLADEDIEVRVVNMPTIKPIDSDLIIDSVQKTGAIITAEEHVVSGGLGGAVAEVVVENCPAPMYRIGLRDRFGQSGPIPDLMKEYCLDAESIVSAVKDTIKRK